MFRYSLGTLLVVVTLTALVLPWLAGMMRSSELGRVDLAGIRMPPERMPDEPENVDPTIRHRRAFGEWFAKHRFVLDADRSTPESSIYRGRFEGSRPLTVSVRFSSDTRAYISIEQAREIYPWEELQSPDLDKPGMRLASELHVWAERYSRMEQAVRRLAGVEDLTWPLSEQMVFKPGVRYSPEGPSPRASQVPEWSRGFQR